jgi:DnaJ-class molecular chaperone
MLLQIAKMFVMNRDNYYVMLGVRHDASVAEVRRVYRQLAHRHHPDLNPDHPHTESVMKALNEAADVLCDPIKRAAYDSVLARDGRVSYNPATSRGYDVEYSVTITADDARVGAQRTLSFHAPNGQPYYIPIVILPGITPGARIRIADAGGPDRDGRQRGDLYVRIIIGSVEK